MHLINFRGDKRTVGLSGVSLLTALLAMSCTQVDTTAEDLGVEQDDLYLKFDPGYVAWPNHTVTVCFDETNGNNPTLLAEVQRIVNATWGRAANLSFPGWQVCNYGTSGPHISQLSIHFCGATTPSSSFCAANVYDNGRPEQGTFRGVTQAIGSLPFHCSPRGMCNPGTNHISLISDDINPFLDRFRYQVVHEFGHALGFLHEQDRPDNTVGGVTNCAQSVSTNPGGTSETPFFDGDSVMNYCVVDPLHLSFKYSLSGGDVFGSRKAYGRNAANHGFMILSDRNSGLAVNAWNGAVDGGEVRLSSICTSTNPDCTWSYQRGMLVSDRDPTLAINAVGGAREGAQLKLAKICPDTPAGSPSCSGLCTPDNPDCTWTYKAGEFLSDRNSSLAINASNGAANATPLLTTAACTANNPDCTWQMPHVMLSSYRDVTLNVNALNGAANAAQLVMQNGCDISNPDCTWTFSKGMILSDRSASLAVNAFGGANNFTLVRISSICSGSNRDCTWTWHKGELISDNVIHGTLPINASGGATQLAKLLLNKACSEADPDCVVNGLFAHD